MFLYYTPCRMSWEACPTRFAFAQLMAGSIRFWVNCFGDSMFFPTFAYILT